MPKIFQKVKTHKKLFIIICVLIILVVAGWIIFEHYHRNNHFPAGNSSTTLNVTIVDEQTWTVRNVLAIKILSDINNLSPLPPNGVYNCPVDSGISYKLTFTHPNLDFLADPSGCGFVSSGDTGYVSSKQFWSDLGKAVNNPNIQGF